MTIFVGDRVQVVRPPAPGRKAPGGAYLISKGKKVVRGKGFSYVAKKLAKGKDGTVFARTDKGTWYATTRLAVKAIATPVAGRGVSTPWGAKPKPNAQGKITYWTTRKRHTGADYAADKGEKIRAVRSGTVYHLWDNVLGNVALLYADNGNTYWYCHTSAYKVKDGAKVKVGDVIALVGDTGTGAPFGPHLHLEVRRGHTRSWAGADFNPVGTW